MSIKGFLKKSKHGINEYTYLHGGVRFLNGTLSLNYYRSLMKDLKELEQQSHFSTVKFPVSNLYPCYEDSKNNAGKMMLHYFFQDLYVAQKIFQNNPQRHVDIGSRIDGFVTHVASFREIEVFDIRPMDIHITNVKFKQADLMNLEEADYESTDSISCLHALEHFGLGRYGDPISYDGYLKGLKNITMLLKKAGKFYFSVPMGNQRIEFHAHRIFSLQYLIKLVSENFTVEEFSYINDKNEFFPEINLAAISESDMQNNFGCNFGCALFVLIKN
ncbi:MAG: DUF268 domain-containing protein [Paludibacteraceae bacterium]